MTIPKKAGINFTIDGNGKKFNGMMTIQGEYDTGAMTIQNVNFVAGAGKDAAIYVPGSYNDGALHNNYVKNVTVDNCTFTDPDGDRNCVAVRHAESGTKFWTINKCTVDNTMHSLLQANNVQEGLKITNCKVNSKNGANLRNGFVLEMSGCEFDVEGYAVRFGSDAGVYDRNFFISDSTLKSACAESDDAVIVFRAGAQTSKLTLTNVTLVGERTFYGNTSNTIIVQN